MPWPWQTGSSSSYSTKDEDSSSFFSLSSKSQKASNDWNDWPLDTDWRLFKEPGNWVPTVIVTTGALLALRLHKVYLRRIPGSDYINPKFYHKRSLFGRVTSVGDGDNFHFFHTPGGRWAGWGWARRVPTDRKVLKGRTIPIRLAGVDAPEGAHFGRPAQPYAAEALQWLQSYILHRTVRAYVYKRDQYERIVATVYLRRWLFLRKDVGLEMLKEGLATTYEAKSGAEFGGERLEQTYRDAEAKAKGQNKGIWAGLGGQNKGWFGGGGVTRRKQPFETPREYKRRMREEDDKAIAKAVKAEQKAGQKAEKGAEKEPAKNGKGKNGTAKAGNQKQKKS